MGKRNLSKSDILEILIDVQQLLDAEIEKSMKSLEKNKSVRCLKKVKKRVDKMAKYLPKMKNTTSRTDYSNNGFSIPTKISKELQTFLQVDTDILTRDEVQSAISAYINIKPDEEREKILRWSHLNTGKDLRSPDNKKIILPDKKLAALLHYEDYKKSVKNGEILTKTNEVVEDDSLYYYVMMKLLSYHFEK